MSLREQWSMMCLRSVFFHLLICFNTVQRENYDNGNHQVKEGVGPIYIYTVLYLYIFTYIHGYW